MRSTFGEAATTSSTRSTQRSRVARSTASSTYPTTALTTRRSGTSSRIPTSTGTNPWPPSEREPLASSTTPTRTPLTRSSETNKVINCNFYGLSDFEEVAGPATQVSNEVINCNVVGLYGENADSTTVYSNSNFYDNAFPAPEGTAMVAVDPMFTDPANERVLAFQRHTRVDLRRRHGPRRGALRVRWSGAVRREVRGRCVREGLIDGQPERSCSALARPRKPVLLDAID